MPAPITKTVVVPSLRATLPLTLDMLCTIYEDLLQIIGTEADIGDAGDP